MEKAAEPPPTAKVAAEAELAKHEEKVAKAAKPTKAKAAKKAPAKKEKAIKPGPAPASAKPSAKAKKTKPSEPEEEAAPVKAGSLAELELKPAVSVTFKGAVYDAVKGDDGWVWRKDGGKLSKKPVPTLAAVQREIQGGLQSMAAARFWKVS